ncbi:MAG TPA: hypothetical protein VHE30_19170 [Polyangiaceae bacterium]|nr:hypothetical protein [Polyangiaceae bacterium]
MKNLTDFAEFERAFVVTSSFLGRREGLGTELGEDGGARAALVARLARGDRRSRAEELARALAPIVVALERRRLG